MELKGNISFNELDMFLSSEGKKVWAVVDENKLVEQSNGFVQIPIFKDRTYGYVRVNKRNWNASMIIRLLWYLHHIMNILPIKNQGNSMDLYVPKT